VVTPDLRERLEVVERLTAIYRPERLAYLFLTTAAFLVLLVAAVFMVYQGNAQTEVLSLMFGSSGMIVTCAGLIIRMWSKALQLIMEQGGA
jgi:hypothetical protein